MKILNFKFSIFNFKLGVKYFFISLFIILSSYQLINLSTASADYLYDAVNIVKPDVLIVFDTSTSMTFDTFGSRTRTYTYGAGIPYNSCSPFLLWPPPWVFGDSGGCATRGEGDDPSACTGSTCVVYPGCDVNDGTYDTDDTLTNDSRVYTAKKAMYDIVNSTNEVRFGLMRYLQAEGTWTDPWHTNSCSTSSWGSSKTIHYNGALNCFDIPNNDVLLPYKLLVEFPETELDDNRNEILLWMDGVEQFKSSCLTNFPNKRTSTGCNPELRASGMTPIAKTLQTAKYYYEDVKDNDDYSSCRGYFIVLVTDGVEDCGGNPEQAASDLALIGVKTFVIGLSTPDATAQSKLNSIAEKGGTTEAYFADNIEELKYALQTAINQATAETYYVAAPIVGTVNWKDSEKNRIADNALFVPFFEVGALGGWQGHLYAYRLFEENVDLGEYIKNVINLDPQSCETIDANKDSGSLKWDAGCELNKMSADSRKIFTEINGSKVEFSTANAGTLMGYLGVATEADAINLIKYIRGEACYPLGSGNVCDRRDWKLGEPYHSSVAVVTPPSNFSRAATSASYNTFIMENNSRRTIIYIGANDGMLHAFDALTGSELWAFIPPSLLGQLKDEPVSHQYYVDLSPKVDDVYIDNEWKTVLVVGEGRGGRYYFALDVTDPELHNDNYPTNVDLLWEFTDANRIGYTWSAPAIGKVGVGGEDKWVAIFGSGYDNKKYTKDNHDYVTLSYMVDIEDASVIAKYEVRATGSTIESVIADPSAMDSDIDSDNNKDGVCDSGGDGYLDRVYVGTTKGTLLKFDVSSVSVSNWLACTFRNFGSSKPLMSSPAVAKVCSQDSKPVLVFTGTGTDRADEPASQEFHVIEDTTGKGTCQQGDLHDCDNDINLDNDERVISSPLLYDNVIYFTTFKPSSSACGSGESYLRCYDITSCDPICTSVGSSSRYIGKGQPLLGMAVEDGQIFVGSTQTGPDVTGDTGQSAGFNNPFLQQFFWWERE